MGLGNPQFIIKSIVRDRFEALRINEDIIYGTHVVYMGFPEREEAYFFCFFALRLVSRVNYGFSF
jgi:hypothetical protein